MSKELKPSVPDYAIVKRGDVAVVQTGLHPEVAKLFEPHSAVNFAEVTRRLDTVNMDDNALGRLRQAAADRIQEVLVNGHFGDLHGAKELLKKLDIEQVEMSGGIREKLDALLHRFSAPEIISLSLTQSLVDETGNLQRAREWLTRQGFMIVDLTDERVREILSLRHILQELYARGVKTLPKVVPLSGLLELDK